MPTTLPPGTAMPAEWAPHERTILGWPTTARVTQLWHEQVGAARDVHATVAATIARFEPVAVVADPADVDDCSRRCGDDVEVVEISVDDSWLRDSGPIVVVDPHGERHALHFGFNAWGEAFTPFAADAKVGARLARHLGLHVHDVTDFVLEGGAIAVDGDGLLVTTERCLLNPNRNPTLGRDEIERRLREWLGVERVVWLRDGIAEDDGTDGHVDNVVAFTAKGSVLLQGCADPANPNHANARDARMRLDGAGVEVVEVDDLPYATVAGQAVPVPYGNLYVCNGAVLVPTVDGGESRWLDVIGACFGDREVVAVPGEVLAYGGGGVHCITQQVPALGAAVAAVTIEVVLANGVPPSPARVAEPNRAPLRVALVQHRWHPDAEEHRAALSEGVRAAAEHGARLVCLQELTLLPYCAITPAGPDAVGVHPEPLPGGQTHEFAADLARELDVFVHASLYEADPAVAPLGYNTAILVGPDGALAGRTRKLHIPVTAGYHEDRYFAPGDGGYPVVDVLNTRLGLPTCWDEWFPEVARAYSLRGAEVIVYPTAIGSEPDHPDFDTAPLWRQVIVANGIANGTFMIVPNRTGTERLPGSDTEITFYGSSFISDPYGRVLVSAPRDEPAVLVTDLDLDQRHDWLDLFPLLTTRRPDTYEPLLGGPT